MLQHAFVINLDRRVDRLSWFMGQYHGSGTDFGTVPLTRVPAVDASTTDLRHCLTRAATQELEQFTRTGYRTSCAQFGPAALGTYASHVRAWRSIVAMHQETHAAAAAEDDDSDTYYMVFEDDAVLGPAGCAGVTACLKAVIPGTIVVFGGWGFGTARPPQATDSSVVGTLEFPLVHWCLHAYALTAGAACRLLETALPMDGHVDTAYMSSLIIGGHISVAIPSGVLIDQARLVDGVPDGICDSDVHTPDPFPATLLRVALYPTLPVAAYVPPPGPGWRACVVGNGEAGRAVAFALARNLWATAQRVHKHHQRREQRKQAERSAATAGALPLTAPGTTDGDGEQTKADVVKAMVVNLEAIVERAHVQSDAVTNAGAAAAGSPATPPHGRPVLPQVVDPVSLVQDAMVANKGTGSVLLGSSSSPSVRALVARCIPYTDIFVWLDVDNESTVTSDVLLAWAASTCIAQGCVVVHLQSTTAVDAYLDAIKAKGVMAASIAVCEATYGGPMFASRRLL